MKKPIKVTGFGSRQPVQLPPEKDDTTEATPSIEEQLVQVILQHYVPANSVNEADAQKTSTELMDEMESVVEPEKNVLYIAMKDAGFKLHYTGESFVWLLKLRQ